MLLTAAFADQAQVVAAVVPVNLGAAANNGPWVSLKNYERVTVLFVKGAGTAGEDPVLTLEQAQAVGGTGAKALPFTRLHVKQHASALPATWTEVVRAAANTYTNDTLAEELAVIAVDVKGEDLDVDGGFDCIRASVPDVGANAQLGCLLYIGWGARYAPPLSMQAN